MSFPLAEGSLGRSVNHIMFQETNHPRFRESCQVSRTSLRDEWTTIPRSRECAHRLSLTVGMNECVENPRNYISDMALDVWGD